MLLNDEEWSKWNNCEIARRCGVSEFLVRDTRPHFDKNEVTERTYTTKHGPVATMNTANIGNVNTAGNIGTLIQRPYGKPRHVMIPIISEMPEGEEFSDEAAIPAASTPSSSLYPISANPSTWPLMGAVRCAGGMNGHFRVQTTH